MQVLGSSTSTMIIHHDEHGMSSKVAHGTFTCAHGMSKIRTRTWYVLLTAYHVQTLASSRHTMSCSEHKTFHGHTMSIRDDMVCLLTTWYVFLRHGMFSLDIPCPV